MTQKTVEIKLTLDLDNNDNIAWSEVTADIVVGHCREKIEDWSTIRSFIKKLLAQKNRKVKRK
jgi:hypothetical protein